MTVFHLSSNRLRVTDPCYTKETWCAGVLENVLPGEWIAEKIVMDDSQTGWGDRIAQLQIWHRDFIHSAVAQELTDIDVGVDSGQAGFFDESQYPEGDTGEYGELDTFYGKVCDGTKGEVRLVEEKAYDDQFVEDYTHMLKTKHGELTPAHVELIEIMRIQTRVRSESDYLGIANVGFGVATHSGYGDGGYQCYVGRNENGEIVAARIVFIGEEGDDENDNEAV